MTDIACGKEHCLLLTEHGQVWSWGGGSRGQLGHGSLANEEKPRLVSALDGMRIRKIAAGGQLKYSPFETSLSIETLDYAWVITN